MLEDWLPCYLGLEAALAQFVTVRETHGQQHIKPLHRHIAMRLVIEGGFHPDEITLHPPLIVDDHAGGKRLIFDSRLHLIKANRAGTAGLASNDIAVSEAGEVVKSIQRYHDVLPGLAGRRFVRDDSTRYEAVSLALASCDGAIAGSIFEAFPPVGSPLSLRGFFETIYRTYGLRFPYLAASVAGLKRLEWHESSPALACLGAESEMRARLGYMPRLG